MDIEAKNLAIKTLNLVNENTVVKVLKVYKKIVNGVFYMIEFEVTDE